MQVTGIFQWNIPAHCDIVEVHIITIFQPIICSCLILYIPCRRFLHNVIVGETIHIHISKRSTIIDFMPECTVFFDLPPDKCFERKGGADCSDRIETGGRDFHMRIYDGYRELAARWPERFEVVDASGTIDEIFSDLTARLKKRGVL